jgi:hypothetical protein
MKQVMQWLAPAVSLSLVMAGGAVAFAQDEAGSPEASATAEEGGEPAADPAGDPAGDPEFDPAGDPAMAPTTDDDKWARWGQRYLDRPRTLPKGVVEAGGYLDLDRVSAVDAQGGSRSTTTTRLYAAAGYGVSDQLEVRLSYGLALDELEAKGPVSAGVGLGLKEGQLALAVAGDFVYDLLGEVGEIGVGARARYKLMPNLALYTQRQLVVTVLSDDDRKPANLRLPVGVGFQLNDQLYLFGETELAVLNLKDSESLTLFADYIPLTVGGVFALSSKLELGGLLYTDLEDDAFDTMLIEAFARIYL